MPTIIAAAFRDQCVISDFPRIKQFRNFQFEFFAPSLRHQAVLSNGRCKLKARDLLRDRNFRFASPISTQRIEQSASLGKVLAQFWSTVPPAAPGWVGLASPGHATPRNAVCPIDSADTFP